MKTKISIIALFSISVLFSSCYTWYEKKIPMDHTVNQKTLADFLYEPEKITSLEAPTQVIASQGLYSGVIKVNWNDVDNATSYRIERAVVMPDSNGNYADPEESDFEVINKYVYSTSYQDIILSKPNTNNPEYTYLYYYRISAENLGQALESSEFTDPLKKNTNACGWLLPTVTNLEASKGIDENKIEIKWKQVPNATSYTIYRGTKAVTQGFSGMELIETVPGNKNSYTNIIQTDDERGKEFYYKLSATLSIGSEAAPSSPALGYSSVPGAPNPPDADKVYVVNPFAESANSLTIKWAPANAGSGNTITNYAVYRTSNVDSTFTLISKCSKDVTSYTDKSCKPGIIYYYYIQTLAEDDITHQQQKSSFSDNGPDSAFPAVGFLLSPPEDLEVLESEDDYSKVILKWSPALGNTEPFNLPFNYNIYYDTDENGSFTSQLVSVSYTDCNYNNGTYEYTVDKQSFYKIKTENPNYIESIFSKPVAPNPEAPTNVTASKTTWFKELESKKPNANQVYPVLITWNKPDNQNAEPAGYNVYRSTKPDSSFRKLNEQLITQKNEDGTYSFIDENETARAGTFYYYKVVSINSLGMGKNGNDPANDPANLSRGYGAITRDQWFREYNKTVKKSQSKLTLMHKSNDMDKLGNETINGDLSGTLSYKAAIAGLGAEITMHYENYSDFYVLNNPAFGKYFVITGNTDTTSNMSANGNMHGIVNCTGMYPGSADYGSLQIKGGAAGGGSYNVETKDLLGNIILTKGPVSWLVGEE